MKRGQAAMEFLMTYGWALLIVLVAIGALAYLGILNPARFVPPKCDLAPGVACPTFKADLSGDALTSGVSTQNILIRLQNGLGETMSFPTGGAIGAELVLTQITSGGSTVCDNVADQIATASGAWVDGTREDFIFDCGGANPSGWALGDKLRATITLRYTSSSLDRTKTGQLVADVEA